NAVYLFGNELMQPIQLLPRRWIVPYELLRKAHGTQRESHHFLDMTAVGKRQLTTAAAQVDQQQLRRTDPQFGNHSQVNQAAFFRAGDHIQVPAGCRFDPFLEDLRIIAVAHGAGGDHAHALHRPGLHSAMKAPQDLQGVGHGLGAKAAIAENTFAQPRYLAVLVQRDQLAFAKLGNAKPNRVRADINSGKNRHSLSSNSRLAANRGSGLWLFLKYRGERGTQTRYGRSG